MQFGLLESVIKLDIHLFGRIQLSCREQLEMCIFNTYSRNQSSERPNDNKHPTPVETTSDDQLPGELSEI